MLDRAGARISAEWCICNRVCFWRQSISLKWAKWQEKRTQISTILVVGVQPEIRKLSDWRKPNTSVRWLCAIFWVTFGIDIRLEGYCYEWKLKYKLYRSFSIICRIVRLQSTRTNLKFESGVPRAGEAGGGGAGGWGVKVWKPFSALFWCLVTALLKEFVGAGAFVRCCIRSRSKPCGYFGLKDKRVIFFCLHFQIGKKGTYIKEVNLL